MASSDGEQTRLQALLDLAAQGDETAYDRLLNMVLERLGTLTRRMLRNYPQLRRWEETDDVLQGAAIRLCRSLKRLQPDSPQQLFGLATVEVRRTLLDLLRHHFGPEGAAGKHFSDVGQGSSGHGGELQNEPDRSDPPETLESWAEFHDAIDRLPDIEREVFHLQWYGGLDQNDIASVLGISVPTVQRQLYRTRHFIRAASERVTPQVRKHDRHDR